MQSTLKRTINLTQSDLSDFDYKPGNLFQGVNVNDVKSSSTKYLF